MADPAPGFSLRGTTVSCPCAPLPRSSAVDPATPASDGLSVWFYRNLLLLIGFGVLSCAWLLHYSDWFETVGGLLALGGAFSWLAFVSRALPDDVLKQMQWKCAHVLGNRSAARVILTATAVFLAAASFLGSIRVEPRQDGFGHYIYIYPDGAAPGEPLGIESGQPTRFVRPAVPYFGSARRIKVPGLPSKRVSFVPWWLSPIYVPHYFDRKVYLVRPGPSATSNLRSNPATIRLTVSGRQPVDIPGYGGYSFWLNCASDVIIPPAKQIEMWYAIPAGKDTEIYKEMWLTPRRLQGVNWDDLDLRNNDRIRIEEIVPPRRQRDFEMTEWTVQESHSYEEAVEIHALNPSGG